MEPPPPPSAAASPRPPEPIEVCTVSTPSVSRITCSTGSRRLVERLEARADRELLRHLEGVLPRRAEEVRLHERRQREGADEDEPGDHERHDAVLQRPLDDRQVAALQARRVLELVDGLLGALVVDEGRRRDLALILVLVQLRGLQEPVREHRHDREGDEQRRGQRDRDGQRERAEQLARDALDERERQEHRDRRDGRRGDRARDLAHGAHDRRRLVDAGDEVALDVLDDDDRVVDDATDRDGERAEREDVERVVGRLQADERDEHRRRDRDRGDEGRAHREQEDEDHDHREQQAEQALGRERLDRLLDVGRLVEHDGEGRAGVRGVERGLQVGQDRPHRVRDLDGVGRGELRDGDGERGLAVHARDARHRVVGELHGCHVVDRRGDRHAHRGLGPGKPARRRLPRRRHPWRATARSPRARAAPAMSSTLPSVTPVCTAKVESPSVMVPAGTSRPFCCSASRIACCVMPRAASSSGFGRDGDALADVADQRGLAHAVDVVDLAERGAGDLVGERADVVGAGDGDGDDREVVEAEREHLRVDVLGQLVGDAVDRREQLLLGEGEVGAVGEARRHAGEPGRARGRRRLEPGDALDRGLDRRRDIRVDDVGRGAGVGVTIESCGNSIEGASSCLRLVSAMPPKIATTTVTSAMSARFFMLSAASRCIPRFSQGHAPCNVTGCWESRPVRGQGSDPFGRGSAPVRRLDRSARFGVASRGTGVRTMRSADAARQVPWLRLALLGAAFAAVWLALSLFAAASAASAEEPVPTPVVEPAVETAVAEVPVAEAPVSEAPVAEAPVAEVPVAEFRSRRLRSRRFRSRRFRSRTNRRPHRATPRPRRATGPRRRARSRRPHRPDEPTRPCPRGGLTRPCPRDKPTRPFPQAEPTRPFPRDKPTGPCHRASSRSRPRTSRSRRDSSPRPCPRGRPTGPSRPASPTGRPRTSPSRRDSRRSRPPSPSPPSRRPRSPLRPARPTSPSRRASPTRLPPTSRPPPRSPPRRGLPTRPPHQGSPTRPSRLDSLTRIPRRVRPMRRTRRSLRVRPPSRRHRVRS